MVLATGIPYSYVGKLCKMDFLKNACESVSAGFDIHQIFQKVPFMLLKRIVNHIVEKTAKITIMIVIIIIISS